MSYSSPEIEDLRRIYSIRGVPGIEHRKRKIIYPLPTHQHANYSPSFSIFVGRDGVERFQCHGTCGLRGDVIDLMGYMNIAGYTPKSPIKVSQAIDFLTSIGQLQVPDPVDPTPQLAPMAWADYTPPGEEVIQYARSRGLHHETLERFRVGQKGNALTIPAFENGVLKAIKLRSLSEKRYWSEPALKTCKR